jgi:glycosyltransferase involved in cell wall biosynthesis
MKITLAHPGVGPFVQQTARALLEEDLLASYWTTFVDQPTAFWRRTLVQAGRMLGLNMERELERRAVTEVPLEFLRAYPCWEVLRSVLTKMRADPRLLDSVWEYGVLSFDRAVARTGLNEINAIYGYEYSSLATFDEAKRHGLACIYEVPSPEHEFVEALIQHEIERFPELDNGTRNYFRRRQIRRSERRRQEWALADVVIVNSTITRNSYAAAGFDVQKVRVIPLGAPPVYECAVQARGGEQHPLRVLWVGTLSIRKGAHYLLSAWKNFVQAGDATLDVYGAIGLPDRMMRDLPPSIRIYPTIPRSELSSRYYSADVLVFPTLCDGFGMVITEAFAHGLPVITTRQAGAVDLVRHGENGLIIAPADSHALYEALQWCATHRTQLKAMRQLAVETARAGQWENYRKTLVGNIRASLETMGYDA